MANRIKGITVEIGGDTTKLSKALEGVNKNIKNTQTQLKDVQKLLRLDPSNTELLSQKHKLLADAVTATKEKLETLKTAAEQANTALANGDISQEQYDALQREIIETEQELQNLQREAEASSTALAKLGQAGEMLEKAGDKIADVGTTLTTHVIKSILTNEKYKGAALLQKKFTVDFLTKKQKVNEGEVPQYYVEDSHEAIIEPEEFELVQAEIARRKEIGKVYSSSNIFSTKLVCSCCGGFFGSKVWHSTSKYRRVIWQCNHKFKNGEKCTTPHLYEDVIKEKFVQVCGMVGEYKEDFLRSCRQIVDMLSDCSAFDKQIGNLQIRADELTAVMQAFIKDNAENAQDQKRYSQRFAEYEKQMNEVESNLQSLQHKKAERLSRKELLLGMISELEKTDMMIHEFDEKLWRLMVEKATVGTDGKLTFTLRNGMEIEV